jgi:hypothetical protein
MTPAVLTEDDIALLGRRMAALQAPDLVLGDWGDRFVGDVCWRKPGELSVRQAMWVAVLVWQQRAHMPAELVPAQEPPRPKPREGSVYARGNR